jgi:hypothetical protein
MSLPDELRRRAQVVRGIPLEDTEAAERIILADVPNGEGHCIQVAWLECPGKQARLSIRACRKLPDGNVVRVHPGLGLEIAWYRLPAVAEAIAMALEMAAECTSIRPTTPEERR